MYAGQGVGTIDTVEPAAAIVERFAAALRSGKAYDSLSIRVLGGGQLIPGRTTASTRTFSAETLYRHTFVRQTRLIASVSVIGRETLALDDSR